VNSGAPVLLRSLPLLQNFSWPNRTSESWKYSSAKGFLDREWQMGDSTSDAKTLLSADNLKLANTVGEWATVILISGGEFRTFGGPLVGIEIVEEPLKDHLKPTPDLPASATEILNRSLIRQTYSIRIQPGFQTARPLAILMPLAEGYALGARVEIEVGAGAVADIVEWMGGTSASAGLIDAAFVYNLEKSARVNVVRVIDGRQNNYILTHSESEIAEDASISAWQVDVGSGWSRQEWTARLGGNDANVQLNGIMHAGINRHVDHQTFIHHDVGNTTSKQLYKSILNKGSRAVFNGKIVIPKNAQKSNSEMLNKNLLLSTKCEIDAKPELLVSANDVKASHGCTVGQLNTDELFYLATRCIDPEQARLMLAKGFALDVVYSIPHLAMRGFALSALEKSLADFSTESGL
jgi:Fe-S cluster assembly protein SufD